MEAATIPLALSANQERAAWIPLALSANQERASWIQSLVDPQETYHRAREGVICYIHYLGRHEVAWKTMPKNDTGDGRVIALYEALQAVRRHFGDNFGMWRWLRCHCRCCIEEMELWKWDDATGDFWTRLAKVLQ